MRWHGSTTIRLDAHLAARLASIVTMTCALSLSALATTAHAEDPGFVPMYVKPFASVEYPRRYTAGMAFERKRTDFEMSVGSAGEFNRGVESSISVGGAMRYRFLRSLLHLGVGAGWQRIEANLGGFVPTTDSPALAGQSLSLNKMVIEDALFATPHLGIGAAITPRLTLSAEVGYFVPAVIRRKYYSEIVSEGADETTLTRVATPSAAADQSREDVTRPSLYVVFARLGWRINANGY